MMNVSVLPGTASPAAPVLASESQRTDALSSAAVERGILVQSSFNTICAIEYMKSHNIAPQVIERVLLHPELRRKAAH